MKSVNKIITVFASACFTLSSCDIDPVLTSSYPDDITWSNETNLQLYINGFYSLIGGYYSITDDACADLLKANNPAANTNLFVFGSTPITSASNLFDNWNNRHSWQLTCCRALEGLEKHRENFTEEVAKRAEAEFRFFRAVANFDLAKRYGASFILYKQLPELGQKEHARCTPDECWDFIAEDLDFAAKNLPLRGTVEAGKLTSGAAYGMKARAMLYAERWKDASDAAAELKKQGYELYEDYGKLFLNRRAKPVANNESVIEFGYVYETLDYSFDYFNCPPSDGGYAEISPTETLVSAYQMADGKEFDWNNPEMAANPYEGREPRFYASILYNGCQWKGETLYTYEGSVDGYGLGGGTTCTGYYMRKLFDPEISKSQMRRTDLTFYYMRYAEVLLNYAEAIYELNGSISNTELNESLNLVRWRSNPDMPGLTTELVSNNGLSMREEIRRERAIELIHEGFRIDDLKRWYTASTDMPQTQLGVKYSGTWFESNWAITNTLSSDGCLILYSGRSWEDKNYLYPLPADQLQLNPQLGQNPGWGN